MRVPVLVASGSSHCASRDSPSTRYLPRPMSTAIFRRVAFPLRAFDYLKQFQREQEAKHGIRLTNNQALAQILSEHQHIAESGGLHHDPITQLRRPS